MVKTFSPQPAYPILLWFGLSLFMVQCSYRSNPYNPPPDYRCSKCTTDADCTQPDECACTDTSGCYCVPSGTPQGTDLCKVCIRAFGCPQSEKCGPCNSSNDCIDNNVCGCTDRGNCYCVPSRASQGSNICSFCPSLEVCPSN
ncbi:MAG: hypothetical protein EP343_24400 [Deltaproteobacteria bacterium]|nr:MAG: hypothetical protein EP343_24400 [Deltaproteobacteria bacterium]